MKLRNVKRLLYSEMVDMGGLPVRQPLPTQKVEQIDPFLLLHHHQGKVAPHSSPRSKGVGPHPHRGFSPVTFVLKGSVHHRDSRGNSSVIHAGGVQWMQAGLGIVHSERPSQELAEKGGEQEIIQLWINTPAAHKMEQPEYFAFEADELPTKVSEDGKTHVQVITGRYMDLHGPIKGKSELLVYRVDLAQGGTFEASISSDYHLVVYNMDAPVQVAGYGLVEGLQLIHFDEQGDGLHITAKEATRLLVLAGKPIQEPVVSYGPFVMNTQTQVMEAMRDAQLGKMGILIEEF
ncbi:pirin family protein [Cytophagales bacterium LB-30]|uniref:Pirin family protein n=1 Tax=Shiella aurantiaca TaxID=3058365 RepID=A0ABT8F0X5_9BACT|nr:pirin family protein [Shiella aurantiaca]MDN4163938.1 pirin family protein [Shiella aurantiaca]